jgi:hypothetical protein
MGHYKIICFRSRFSEFKTHANDLISEMPADNNDEFALVMATSLRGAVGFGGTTQGDAAIRALVSKCYSVDLEHLSIQVPMAEGVERMPRLLFRDKAGRFEELVQEHLQYDKDLRKYNVISRYRSPARPKRSTLANILKDQRLSIVEKKSYEALNESCHYILRAVVSGEHGPDAFFAFSTDLSYFFDEFEKIVGGNAEIRFVKSPAGLIYY